MKERTNEQWLADLRAINPDEALTDLYDLLVRGLRAGLGSYGGGVDANAEDFAQEALIKITDNLDSFRGESRFTTWAQKIAMNVALTELKRRRWRDVSLQDLFARREAANREPADTQDRKSTRLNSSHANISYAVFCLKKKKQHNILQPPDYRS